MTTSSMNPIFEEAFRQFIEQSHNRDQSYVIFRHDDVTTKEFYKWVDKNLPTGLVDVKGCFGNSTPFTIPLYAIKGMPRYPKLFVLCINNDPEGDIQRQVKDHFGSKAMCVIDHGMELELF